MQICSKIDDCTNAQVVQHWSIEGGGKGALVSPPKIG